MWRLLLRSLWRLIILLIGIGLAWIIVRVYPIAEDRLPTFIVLLLIYIFVTYIGVPALIRLLAVFIKPNQIPLFATTRDGWSSDPVNIALIVTDKKHLIKSMTKAGWHVADPLTFKTGIHEILSILFDTPYPNAPFSKLYLFNRPHDIGFQISTNNKNSARTRHHVRLWRLEEPTTHDQSHSFWKDKLKHLFKPEKEMWIGTATEDIQPIAFRWPTGHIIHGVSHDANKERDFIIQTLKQANAVSKDYVSAPGEEIRFRGQQMRVHFNSNGSIKIAKLR